MPSFFYINPLGKKEEIFPHYRSIVPNCYVCENTQAKQLHIHESCIIVEHSEEEINTARKAFLEKNLSNLLHNPGRVCNDNELKKESKTFDK